MRARRMDHGNDAVSCFAFRAVVGFAAWYVLCWYLLSMILLPDSAMPAPPWAQELLPLFSVAAVLRHSHWVVFGWNFERGGLPPASM